MTTMPTQLSPTGVYTDWNTGPEAAPYIKRSRYLAAALQGMQESGKSIQSYPELGLKLLSQALLSYGDKKNDEKLKAAQQTDIGNETASMLAGLGGGSPAPAAAPAAPMSFASEQDPSLASAPTSAPITSSPLAPVAAPKTSRDLDLLARTLIGEAGNQGDQGQQAVAQVIKNRADKSGMTIPDVIMAKGQFEPWSNPATRSKLEGLDPNSPQYQAALTNAQAVMGGTAQLPPNVAGADHFYSPSAQSALGRQAPSWDNGSGADLGGHRFFNLGYNAPPGYQPQGQGQPPPQGAPPPMGQPPGPQAPAPQLSMPELAQGPQGAPQPFQVAQNGGLPPMPSQGAQPPAGGHGATPEEIQLVTSWMKSGNPQKVEAARAYAQKIQQRMAAPPEYEVRIDPNTQQAYYAPKDPRDGAPLTSNIPGARGQLQQGWEYGSDNRAHPIAGTENRPLTDPAERARFGIQPTDHAGYTVSPTNQVTKTADNPYGADRVQAIRQDIEKAPEIQNWSVVAPVWASMKEAVNHKNRAGDLNLVYGVAKLMDPGSVVREGEQVLVNQTNSLPDQLIGMINKLNGGAALQDDTRAALMTEAGSRAQAVYQNAQPKLQFYKDFAARNSIDARDIIPNLPAYEGWAPRANQANGQQSLPHDGGAPANSGVGGVSNRPVVGGPPRRAPDGHLYEADPSRPGKYRMVPG